MKLFVISDTHRQIDKAKEVFARLHDIDCIIHLGDYTADAIRLERELETEVISVPGNMDGSSSSDDFKILDTECGKLLLTHGHMDQVKVSPLNLCYRAQEHNCIAALFGHTHRPVYEQANGIYLVNPGSLSRPRDGSQGSYSIVTTTPDGFHCAIVYYSSLSQGKGSDPSSRKKPPVQGGVLRKLLNYSDRF